MNASGQLLKNNTLYTASGGQPLKVGAFLGGGGQGEVYQTELSGNAVALKWYFPSFATPEQRQALEMLVRKGAPNNKFLWPLDLVSSREMSGFGYIMPLRGVQYHSIVDLMRRRVKPEPGFRALMTAGFELADSFLRLHALGLCYRDISDRNVFFNPLSGEILICDNDNVAIDRQGRASIYGTPRFMAPEIVRGEAQPGTQTDLYSLAVLLFMLLMISHPLDGKKEAAIHCFDLPAMHKIYGFEPLFIFDPGDHSNRPVPGVHDNALIFWQIYPQLLRDLFTRAFTTGLHDAENGRVRESEWRAALSTLRDQIFYCPSCGAENFPDSQPVKASGLHTRCWSCGAALRLPYRLRIGGVDVMLNHDTRLYPHHINPQKLYDFSTPVAEVTRHPADPNVWGLKNLSSQKWVVSAVDGSARDVDPGRSATLTNGLCINFGHSSGEIEV